MDSYDFLENYMAKFNTKINLTNLVQNRQTFTYKNVRKYTILSGSPN